jgi:hypothetical protein
MSGTEKTQKKLVQGIVSPQQITDIKAVFVGLLQSHPRTLPSLGIFTDAEI